jgi:hypothetical protein
MSDAAKPQKVYEPIWACEYDSRTGRCRWSEAIIVSRGGANPNRVTIAWGGRKRQRHEDGDDAGWFSAPWARAQVVFWRDRKAGEALHRSYNKLMGLRDQDADAWDLLDLQPGASKAAITKAFNAKVQKVHPDKGGDAAITRALLKARDACLAAAEDD